MKKLIMILALVLMVQADDTKYVCKVQEVENIESGLIEFLDEGFYILVTQYKDKAEIFVKDDNGKQYLLPYGNHKSFKGNNGVNVDSYISKNRNVLFIENNFKDGVISVNGKKAYIAKTCILIKDD